jgi:hypothetical protein
MKTLEEIVYDAGRHALADQEALVAGIRQRTGTLLAAHALVASFFGAATIPAAGLDRWRWAALTALLAGLVLAAILLAPWKLKFSLDASSLYDALFEEAAVDAVARTFGWLASAGSGYQLLRDQNAPKVRLMSQMAGALSVSMVVQTLFWVVDLVR